MLRFFIHFLCFFLYSISHALCENCQNVSNTTICSFRNCPIEEVKVLLTKCHSVEAIMIFNTSMADLKDLFIGTQLNNLTHLSVTQSLTSIATLTKEFQSIRFLNLTGNCISKLSFENLTNLVELHLDQNNLTQVSLDFKRISNIKTINLLMNPLQQVTVQNLQSSKNPFMKIIMNSDLDYLDLSGNDITTFEFLNLTGSIKNLNLRNNRLSNLTEIVEKFSTVGYINETNNPFECSMDLSETWLRLKRRGTIFEGEVRCFFPSSKTQSYSTEKYGWYFSNEDVLKSKLMQEYSVQFIDNVQNFSVISEIDADSVTVTINVPLMPDDNETLDVTFISDEPFQTVSFFISLAKSTFTVPIPKHISDKFTICYEISVTSQNNSKQARHFPKFCHIQSRHSVDKWTCLLIVFIIYILCSLVPISYTVYHNLPKIKAKVFPINPEKTESYIVLDEPLYNYSDGNINISVPPALPARPSVSSGNDQRERCEQSPLHNVGMPTMNDVDIYMTMDSNKATPTNFSNNNNNFSHLYSDICLEPVEDSGVAYYHDGYMMGVCSEPSEMNAVKTFVNSINLECTNNDEYTVMSVNSSHSNRLSSDTTLSGKKPFFITNNEDTSEYL